MYAIGRVCSRCVCFVGKWERERERKGEEGRGGGMTKRGCLWRLKIFGAVLQMNHGDEKCKKKERKNR